MNHSEPFSGKQSGGFVEGYLLEPLNLAIVEADGTIQPTLARFAVFDFLATYNGTGDRHEQGSYVFDWQRVGQAAVANLMTDASGQVGVYVLAEKKGDVLLARAIGCNATGIDIGSIE